MVTAIIISQYIQMSSRYVVHMKLIILHVNYSLVKNSENRVKFKKQTNNCFYEGRYYIGMIDGIITCLARFPVLFSSLEVRLGAGGSKSQTSDHITGVSQGTSSHPGYFVNINWDEVSGVRHESQSSQLLGTF